MATHSIKPIYEQITAFYKEKCPFLWDDYLIKTATEEELQAIEDSLGEKLPSDYREFLLINDIKFAFDGNFECLTAKRALGNQRSMTELLKEGVFDDGRVEYHKKEHFGNWDSGCIQEVWWSEKWLPISADGCGNMKCLDFAPTTKGNMHQLISMEVQDGQGPFLSEYKNFEHYLTQHLYFLKNQKYYLEEDWKGRPNIVPDRFA